MTTRLEELINTIGGSALMYINGRFHDKEQKKSNHDIFFKLTTEDELNKFIDDVIERACGDGITKGTDVSGRRLHLEYILKVYKFARTTLNSAADLDEQDWDDLSTTLDGFLNNCNDLMSHDKDLEFQGVQYKLSSLKHQTASAYLPFASKTGNLGACLTEYVFKVLKAPSETPFFSQVASHIEAEKLLVIGKSLKDYKNLQHEVSILKPQVGTLTAVNLTLVERLKSQQSQIDKLQQQIEKLSAKQSTNSSDISTLTQFGFLAKTITRDEHQSEISQASITSNFL